MADTAAVALASELLVDVRALGKKMSHVTTLQEAAEVQRTAHGVIEVCGAAVGRVEDDISLISLDLS